MRGTIRFTIALIACGCLALTWVQTIPGQTKPEPAQKQDAKILRDALKEVINTGAELFNKYGDQAGCYRLYQGSLLTIKPFLNPTAQKEVEDVLAAAEMQPRFADRAFAVRKMIDTIRAQAAGKK